MKGWWKHQARRAFGFDRRRDDQVFQPRKLPVHGRDERLQIQKMDLQADAADTIAVVLKRE
jgi:hypothetical protein